MKTNKCKAWQKKKIEVRKYQLKIARENKNKRLEFYASLTV